MADRHELLLLVRDLHEEHRRWARVVFGNRHIQREARCFLCLRVEAAFGVVGAAERLAKKLARMRA